MCSLRSIPFCVPFQILHSSGQSLQSSWSVILDVINSATTLQRSGNSLHPPPPLPPTYYEPLSHIHEILNTIHFPPPTHPLSLSEALVRAGFQSLQLVIADFLPVIPPLCLPTCVEVVGQYGLQTVDINVSLTSIGLLVISGLRLHYDW